jgi:succinate dehydrogenase / fumarate reductase, cytochrome b subunit
MTISKTRFYSTSIGKKVVMAATGLILFSFVVIHLLGNLQIYAGPAKLNGYAAFLRGSPGLLWTARAILLLTLCLHVLTGLQLKAQSWRSRPIGYRCYTPAASSLFSRNMLWSGLLLGCFIVFHVLHLTVGLFNPRFVAEDVHRNVLFVFSSWGPVAIYVAAMMILGAHVIHGVFSLFQSLGLVNHRHDTWRRRFATVATLAVLAGNVSMPVSVVITAHLAR